jgi:ABC-type Fe3+ transport system substrate-binding protein
MRNCRTYPRSSLWQCISHRFACSIGLLLWWAPFVVQADTLVILSPHWEGIKYEFTQAFKAFYSAETGREVDVEWMDVGGTSEILRFVKSEFTSKPMGIGVDLLFGGGLDPFLVLKQTDLLQAYTVPFALLQHIPPDFGGMPLYDPDLQWFGATLSGFGILYNKIVLARLHLPEVATWEDLSQPALFTWVGSADPRQSGSVHMMYEIILQAYGWNQGWDMITGIGANVRYFTPGAAQTPKDTALGEVAYGLSIDFQAWAQINDVGIGQLGFVMPKQLTVITPDALAMLKGAPNRAVAEAFIRFVLSPGGQKLWLLRRGVPGGPQRFQLNRFSILPNLYTTVAAGDTAVQLNPFSWGATMPFNAKLAAARWSIVNDLIGTLIVDQKRSLNRAWRAAMADGLNADERQRLTAMPVSEAEALRLAEDNWHQAAFRNATLNAWTQFAKRKYQTELSWLSLLPQWFTLIVAGLGLSGLLVSVWKHRRMHH